MSDMSEKKRRKSLTVRGPRRADNPEGEPSARQFGPEGRNLRPSEPMMPAEAMPPLAFPSMADYTTLLLERRRSRGRRVLLRFAVFILLPTALAFYYAYFYAAPRFVSTIQLTYQTYNPPTTLSGGLVQSVFGTSQSGQDYIGSILYEYLRSPALLKKLDDKLHLKAYYSSDKIDWPMRLSADASDETFLQYYNWHIADVAEGLGGYLTVTVEAYDPQMTLALSQAIVGFTDEMLEGMSDRAKADEVKYAGDELKRQEDRVLKARQAMTAFQNLHGDINPPTVATQLGNIVGTLESDLATARAQLKDLLAYLSPDSIQVTQLKTKIAAYERQLQDQRTRLATNGGGIDPTGMPYSKVLEEYTALQLENQFAQTAYLAAQQGLTVARANAARKQNYLVDFVPPQLPDRRTKWYPITIVLTVFIGSICIYALTSLVIGAFRDQAGV